jgi:hypothetical protein
MLFQFAIRLICGMGLMLGLMPHRSVRSGFFRVQMLIILGLAVLGALAGGIVPRTPASAAASLPANPAWQQTTRSAACVAIAAMAFLGSVFWTLERRRAGSLLLGLITLTATGALAVSPLLFAESGAWQGEFLLPELSSAALLGGAMTAMLLGHAYLTAPGMSLDPLKRLNLYFGIAGFTRAALSLAALVIAWNQVAQTGTYLQWLALRWLAGIIGPLVMWWMVRQILTFRNTQAATGVLFVGVILTFIGELTASLLFGELKIPY